MPQPPPQPASPSPTISPEDLWKVRTQHDAIRAAANRRRRELEHDELSLNFDF